MAEDLIMIRLCAICYMYMGCVCVYVCVCVCVCDEKNCSLTLPRSP